MICSRPSPLGLKLQPGLLVCSSRFGLHFIGPGACSVSKIKSNFPRIPHSQKGELVFDADGFCLATGRLKIIRKYTPPPRWKNDCCGMQLLFTRSFSWRSFPSLKDGWPPLSHFLPVRTLPLSSTGPRCTEFVINARKTVKTGNFLQ